MQIKIDPLLAEKLLQRVSESRTSFIVKITYGYCLDFHEMNRKFIKKLLF